MNDQAEAKRRIGEKAAEKVTDGMSLFIDGSTTSFWVARHFGRQRNLSVITNGLEIARELSGRNNNRVFLAGGQMSEAYLSTFGPSAIDFVSQFHVDLAIIGVSAVHPEWAFTTCTSQRLSSYEKRSLRPTKS